MRLKNCYIFISLIFLFTLACEKDDSPPAELPEATTTGEDMFACKVDGEIWVADRPFNIYGSDEIVCWYNEDSGDFEIEGRREIDELTDYINVHAKFMSEGEFVQIVDGDDQTAYRDKISYSVTEQYYHIPDNPGSIKITRLDTSKNIVSGLFSMEVQGDMIKIDITDGRFDVVYSD